MGRQGPYGPRTPAESCEHSKVDGVWYRLYSVLKVSVACLEAGTLRPRTPGQWPDCSLNSSSPTGPIAQLV